MMSDITMCTGEDCPLKKNCFRFTAIPNPYMQSYFAEIPWKGGISCKHYVSDGRDKKDCSDEPKAIDLKALRELALKEE